MSIAVGLAGSTLAIWVYLILARGGYWRLQDGPVRRLTPAVWPGITCIIPARDEAEHVGETLRSLSAQQYAGPLKILLVDDQSTDATAAIAETFDAVTVLRGSSLPPQWTGKLWALQQGLDHTANKWPASAFVLFTDADICWHDPHALSELTAEALAQDLVLNSRMVTLRCESAAERALVPAFVYFFPQLYPFRWINDPSHAMAGAAGGCMLLRRDALDRAGGLQAIRGALIDDCALGALMKRQGAIRLALGTGLSSLRPYPALADIRAMVVRSAYAQLRYSRVMLAACIGGLALTYLAPPVLTLLAHGPARWMAAAAWLLMTLSYVPILGFYNLAWWRAFSLPAIAALYGAFTIDSAYQHERGRGGYWKGRTQALGGSRP